MRGETRRQQLFYPVLLPKEAITFKLQRPNCVPRSPSQALKNPSIRFQPHQRCCVKYNTFGVGSAHPPKHAPLEEITREYNLRKRPHRSGAICRVRWSSGDVLTTFLSPGCGTYALVRSATFQGCKDRRQLPSWNKRVL